MTDDSFQYVGQELDVFALAKNWKRYWISQIAPFVRGDVLEVGAGIGSNTRALQNATIRTWHCLEPDPALASRLESGVQGVKSISVSCGSIANLAGRTFDSIIYIDVLEHIEKDAEEVAQAARLLRPGGHLVVLSPAHQWLFSEFDAAIGHFRRYNRASLTRCLPPGCTLEKLVYLDCFGMLLSFGNRMLLHDSLPKPKQILFWDNYVIQVSRVIDPLFGYRLGKTIIAVWTAAP